MVSSWREIWAAHLLGMTYATTNWKLILSHSNEQIPQELDAHTSKRQFSIYESCHLWVLVIIKVHQIVFWEHTLLCFFMKLILFWRRAMLKNPACIKQFSLKSCLAVVQNKRKKQLGLYLVIHLYASGTHLWNNSKGPIHFIPPAAKWMWVSGCYFHSARHLLLIKKNSPTSI